MAFAYGDPAHDGPALAYVVNTSSNTVSVIDTRTETVTSTIAVGNDQIGLASPRRLAEPTPWSSPTAS
jgi:YVTN family beta-propeller protein